MGRPSNKSQYIAEIMRRYVEEEYTRGEISRDLGISVQTLTRWLAEEGVEFENRPRDPNTGRSPEVQAEINQRISESRTGKGAGPRKASTAEISCAQCGIEFSPRTAAQRFCSRPCSVAAGALAVATNREQEWLQGDASLCPCGVNRIPYTARHTAKYCSPSCREKYGMKRGKTRDEANHATFNCQHCGLEVTRPRGQGAAKYCSSECANKHVRIKKHIVVDDATVLDSGLEALLWGLCVTRNIPIQRYDRQAGIEWRPGGWYAPDFTVGIRGQEIAIEVKGSAHDDDDPARWEVFRKEVGPLVVLFKEDLLALTSTRGTVMDALSGVV